MKRGDKDKISPPMGIKLISLILYILAGIFIILGIATIFAGIILHENKEILTNFASLILAGDVDNSITSNLAYSEVPLILGYMGPLFIALGLSLIVIGLVRIFLGFHLWNGRIWTKVLIVSFSLMWISFGFQGIANGIIWPNLIAILFNSAVFLYILFSRKASEFFRHLN